MCSGKKCDSCKDNLHMATESETLQVPYQVSSCLCEPLLHEKVKNDKER